MSGRKKFDDDDASRLPPGMERVGYDADTQRYTFREGDNLWVGEPGSFYGGNMKYVGRSPGATRTTAPFTSIINACAMPSASMRSTQSTVEEIEDEEDEPDTVPPYNEHEYKPMPSNPIIAKEKARIEWGVPVVFMSDTDARPTDNSQGAGAALKSRASRFKKAVASVMLARRVVQRLASRKRYAPQDSEPLISPEGYGGADRS